MAGPCSTFRPSGAGPSASSSRAAARTSRSEAERPTAGDPARPKARRRRPSSSRTAASIGPSRRFSGRCSPTRATPARAASARFSGRRSRSRSTIRTASRSKRRSVTTNDFGTAAGEFAIPAGRALGAWRVATLARGGGGATVRVEEYKRPTFEVTLKDSTEALRLNRPGAADRRGALLLRPAGLFRHRALERDAHAELPVVVLVARIPPRGPDARRSRPAAPPSRPTARSRSRSRRRPTSGSPARARRPISTPSPPTPRTRAARPARRRAPSDSDSSRSRRASTCPAAFLRAGGRSEVTVVRTNLDGAPRAGSGRVAPLSASSNRPRRRCPADLPPDPAGAAGGRPPDAGRRSAPPVADRVRAGAGHGAVEERRRGRAGGAHARREGHRADRGPEPLRRRLPPASTGRATSSAPSTRRRASSSSPRRARRSRFRPSSSPRRLRSRSAGRRGSSRRRACPARTSISRSTGTGRPSSGGRSSRGSRRRSSRSRSRRGIAAASPSS